MHLYAEHGSSLLFLEHWRDAASHQEIRSAKNEDILPLISLEGPPDKVVALDQAWQEANTQELQL